MQTETYLLEVKQTILTTFFLNFEPQQKQYAGIVCYTIEICRECFPKQNIKFLIAASFEKCIRENKHKNNNNIFNQNRILKAVFTEKKR